MAIGVAVALALAKPLRTDLHMLWVDTLLGGIGICGGIFAGLAMPWRGEYVSDGWTIRNQFPYPFAAAFLSSLLFPACFEAVRALRSRRG